MGILNVPEIGDLFALKTDWTFDLYFESRNTEVWSSFGYSTPVYTYRQYPHISVVIPAGTVLRLDRIYIRQGKEDLSSLTFYIESSPLAALNPDPKSKGFKKGRKRFWAKLEDCNRIEYV